MEKNICDLESQRFRGHQFSQGNRKHTKNQEEEGFLFCFAFAFCIALLIGQYKNRFQMSSFAKIL